MNKKTMKIIGIMSIVLCVILSVVPVFAAGDGGILDELDQDPQAVGEVTQIGAKIINVITNIGMVVAVAVLVILGIKYMMGSAEEKAEYKKTLIPYFIGALLIFSAAAIVKVIASIQF